MKRRDFLKVSGLGLGMFAPTTSLLVHLIQSFFNEAKGNQYSQNYYVTFASKGGPPRWMFDAPLNMNNNPNFKTGTMVGTKLKPVDGYHLEYATHLVNDVRLPYIWGTNVPSISGGVRSMEDLANNGIFIRGYKSLGTHTHAGNGNLTPSINSHSLHSIPALNTNAPMPIITSTIAGNLNYRSLGVGSKINFSARDGIGSLFNTFSLKNGRSLLSLAPGNEALENQLNHALKIVENSGVLKSNAQKILFKDREMAVSLFKMYTDALVGEYDQLVEKYVILVNRTYREMRTPGIDLSPIVSDGGSKFQFGSGRFIEQGTNLIDTLQYGHNNYLAESFALAEFLIKNNISSSINLPLGGRAIHFEQGGSPSIVGNGNGLGSGHDSHEVGTLNTLLYYTKFYQAVGSCMLELIDRLKEDGKWQKTFIHLFGDFGRRPQGHSGSTHGPRCSSVSIFSGLRSTPLVIGNTKISRGGNQDYGEAAPLTSLDGKVIQKGNIASSIASLLQGPSPTVRSLPLFMRKNNSIISLSDNPTSEDDEN